MSRDRERQRTLIFMLTKTGRYIHRDRKGQGKVERYKESPRERQRGAQRHTERGRERQRHIIFMLT